MGLTKNDESKAYSGYTLFSTEGDFYAYLIDIEGRVVQRWEMPYTPGQYGELLPNGNILFLGRTDTALAPGEDVAGRGIGGYSGILIEIDWSGNLVWQYKENYMHHSFYRKKNGNTLILRWFGPMPSEIARKIHKNISTDQCNKNHEVWSTGIQEISSAGNVVWEWRDYDHLDPEIDRIGPKDACNDWMHANKVEELANGNILMCARNLNSIYIINRKSGHVEWRWGSGELANPHDATSLDNGNILIFDNGMYRAGSEICYSRVVEVNPKTSKVEWEYLGDPLTAFYSSIQSGCQRLLNGNTLVTESTQGRLFEVTREKEIVWEFINPFYAYYLNPGWSNMIFKAFRYEPGFEGLRDRELEADKFKWINRAKGLDKITSVH
jgi:hypothetical protein